MNKKDRFIKTLKETRLILPPLCGFTDYPYRRILSLFCPPFTITEMIKARALAQKIKGTLEKVKKEDGDHLKGVQLLGSDPEIMAAAARDVENMGFDYVDINMGCTVKKVATKGEGISLMKDEGRAAEITEHVSSSVSIPVTVKLRTGFSRENINVLSLSQKLAQTGIQAITIHARTGEKKFGVEIDKSIIKEASRMLPIPVVANGGIFNGDDAVNMLKETGADAVMPGRGILGNPWIIREILSRFSGKTYKAPALLKRKEICLKHLEFLCEEYGEHSGTLKMRKILSWYFPKCRNLKSLRVEAQTIAARQDVEKLLDRLAEEEHYWIFQ